MGHDNWSRTDSLQKIFNCTCQKSSPVGRMSTCKIWATISQYARFCNIPLPNSSIMIRECRVAPLSAWETWPRSIIKAEACCGKCQTDYVTALRCRTREVDSRVWRRVNTTPSVVNTHPYLQQIIYFCRKCLSRLPQPAQSSLSAPGKPSKRPIMRISASIIPAFRYGPPACHMQIYRSHLRLW